MNSIWWLLSLIHKFDPQQLHDLLLIFLNYNECLYYILLNSIHIEQFLMLWRQLLQTRKMSFFSLISFFCEDVLVMIILGNPKLKKLTYLDLQTLVKQSTKQKWIFPSFVKKSLYIVSYVFHDWKKVRNLDLQTTIKQSTK